MSLQQGTAVAEKFALTGLIVACLCAIDWLMSWVHCLFVVVGDCIVPYSLPTGFWSYALCSIWTAQALLLLFSRLLVNKA